MDKHKVHFTVSLLIKNEGINIQLTTRAANMELRESVPKPSLALILDWRLAVPWNAVNWIIKAQLMAVTFFKIRHFSFVDILNLPCCEASSSVSSLGGLWGTPSPPSPCAKKKKFQSNFNPVLKPGYYLETVIFVGAGYWYGEDSVVVFFSGGTVGGGAVVESRGHFRAAVLTLLDLKFKKKCLIQIRKKTQKQSAQLSNTALTKRYKLPPKINCPFTNCKFFL